MQHLINFFATIGVAASAFILWLCIKEAWFYIADNWDDLFPFLLNRKGIDYEDLDDQKVAHMLFPPRQYHSADYRLIYAPGEESLAEKVNVFVVVGYEPQGSPGSYWPTDKQGDQWFYQAVYLPPNKLIVFKPISD